MEMNNKLKAKWYTIQNLNEVIDEMEVDYPGIKDYYTQELIGDIINATILGEKKPIDLYKEEKVKIEGTDPMGRPVYNNTGNYRSLSKEEIMDKLNKI